MRILTPTSSAAKRAATAWSSYETGADYYFGFQVDAEKSRPAFGVRRFTAVLNWEPIGVPCEHPFFFG